MEFQEALVRLMIGKPNQKGRLEGEKGKSKHKWKFSLHRSSFSSSSSSSSPSSSPISISKATISSKKTIKKEEKTPPMEFMCPISGSLMSDPVIVSSGHTFERACVQACNTLGFVPEMLDGSEPSFSAVIPNIALKTTILNWCNTKSLNPPKTLDFFSAEKLVTAKMQAQQQKKSDNDEEQKGNNSQEKKSFSAEKLVRAKMEAQQPKKSDEDREQERYDAQDLINRVEEKRSMNLNHAVTELTRRSNHFHSSSEESVASATPPLQLTTRPSCLSSSVSSSSENDALNPNPNPEEEEFVQKLNGPLVFDIEEALFSMRKMTRTKVNARIELCTPRMLSIFRSLMTSRYTNVQVNSVACLVNLSLEKVNKVKIVRSGLIPPLIDVLKGGFPEAQEHACGAIFSLALDDHNKTAIGVLGALPPLLRLLWCESEITRLDSALALYHLSLVQINRIKLVRLGSVSTLLGMVRSGHLRSRILLVLGNLAAFEDGRASLLDSGGVECLVGLLRDGELESESTRESCVNVLLGLSQCGLRFNGLAKAAGAGEVLGRLEKEGDVRIKEKARRILEVMKGRVEEEEEEVDWEALLDSGSISRTRFQLGGGKDASSVSSSEFE